MCAIHPILLKCSSLAFISFWGFICLAPQGKFSPFLCVVAIQNPLHWKLGKYIVYCRHILWACHYYFHYLLCLGSCACKSHRLLESMYTYIRVYSHPYSHAQFSFLLGGCNRLLLARNAIIRWLYERIISSNPVFW